MHVVGQTLVDPYSLTRFQITARIVLKKYFRSRPTCCWEFVDAGRCRLIHARVTRARFAGSRSSIAIPPNDNANRGHHTRRVGTAGKSQHGESGSHIVNIPSCLYVYIYIYVYTHRRQIGFSSLCPCPTRTVANMIAQSNYVPRVPRGRT